MVRFKHENTQTGRRFACDLECNRCTARTSGGTRCRRRVCVGTKVCFQHRKRDMGLRIAPSNIPGAGKGLFATRRLPPNTHVVTYDGEKLTDAQLNQRYDTDNNGGHAPYGLKVTQPSAQHRGKTVDSACQRSLASIINGSRTRSLSNVRYSNSARADGSIKVFTRNRAIQPGAELLAWYGAGYWASAANSRHTTR